jgi:hypothetical protein
MHVVAEAFLAPNTTAHQMVNGSLILDAQLPRHAHFPSRAEQIVKKTRSLSKTEIAPTVLEYGLPLYRYAVTKADSACVR